MKLLKRLSEIPNNAEISIYGAGSAGKNVLRLLEEFRPDVVVVRFIDGNRSGSVDQLPIIGLTDYLACNGGEPAGETFILIASLQWREIEKKLIFHGVSRYLVIPPHFFFPSAYGRLKNFYGIAPSDNPLSPDLFSQEDRRLYRDFLKEAANLLENPGERRLFHILTGETEGSKTRVDEVSEYYYLSPDRRQYFDFVNFENVHVLLEGGVATGSDTGAFLNAMPHDGHIYGFEPNLEEYLAAGFRQDLLKNPNVDIIPRALWSVTTTLCLNSSGFSSNILDSQSQTTAGADVDDEKSLVKRSIRNVSAVSADDFVREKNLERVDFIKLDVEGAELEVLKGALETMNRFRPQIAVCIYHRKEDFFQIPLFLAKHLKNYEHRLEHYSACALETVWYAVPR